MKLIYAIVNNDDAGAVARSLTAEKYQITKLSTTGGFLMNGNTTFLIACDSDAVDRAFQIIGEKSRTRKQVMPSAASYGLGLYPGAPVEVTVGGATVFVTDIERFEKL